MSTETETPLSAAISTVKKQRGRPAKAAAETPVQKIERLQAELKQAQAALQANEEKRAAITGHAVLRHIRHNTEFARQLAAALRAEVKTKADRTVIQDLLGDDLPPASISAPHDN